MKEERKERRRKYCLQWYHNRRKQFLEKLGNKCVMCGSTENLQFDHIDPSTKTVDIGRLLTTKRAFDELSKCQLLCKKCHILKTHIRNDTKRIKISDQQVAEIRALYKTGNFSQKALADKFGIHQTHVGDIVNNQRRTLTA